MPKSSIKQVELDTTAFRVFTWSAIVFIVGMLIAQAWLMGFLPAPHPGDSLSPEQLKQLFIDRKFEIQLGSVIQMILWTTWATWCIVVTTFMRKMERGYPILTYVSIALTGAGLVIVLLIPMTWAVCAFRPEAISPDVLVFANDWAWFLWLFTWPPFSLWFFCIARAILRDHNVPTIYPRWVAYMNISAGLLICPAAMIVFFRDGPFAYDGLFAFWFPVFIFFGEIVVMALVSLRVITQQDARLQAAAEAGSPDVAAIDTSKDTPMPVAGA